MKLLTLNAHAHLEADYERKLVYFAEYAIREQIDLIAMQEVNQSCAARAADGWLLTGCCPLQAAEAPVRSDNHAAWAAFLIRQAGIRCHWAWLPVKRGYGRFDEGLAILSLGHGIAEADACFISRTDEYGNWKRRAALGVRLKEERNWYYSAHMGWWNDEEDGFAGQWQKLNAHLAERKNGCIWLMGDFNSPDSVRGEGYDLICKSGWHDVCRTAQVRRGHDTMPGSADGWEGADAPGRIDHIFCSQPVCLSRAQVVFDGVHERRISDHFGILAETIETKREENMK